ncbi:MAG: MFS transporter [Acidimicrobiales bacterium]
MNEDFGELVEGLDELVADTNIEAWQAAELAAQAVDPDVVLGGPALAETSTAAKTWALFSGLALVMMGNGLQGAVLGIRSQSEGFGVTVGGLIMTAYFVGFLLGSRYAEHALRTVGHIRVFAALASTASSASLMHVLWVNPYAWAGLRLVFGLCMAGLYVVVESWLSDLSTNANRGRLLALYMVVSMGFMAAGQFLLNAADPATFTLFALASVLVSISLVPVTLSATSSPPLHEPVPLGFRELLRLAPSGVAVSFLSGTGLGGLIGLTAVYAGNTDLGGARLSIWLAAPVFGAIVLQWPIGWLSDRLPRRAIIAAVAVAAATLSFALFALDATSKVGTLLLLMLGATAYPLYSLAIAITQDWVQPKQIVGASATLVRANGTGAIVGPLVTAGLMAIDTDLLWIAQMAAYSSIAVFLVYRIFVVEAIPLDQQAPYQAFPARASERAAVLLQRRRTKP